MLLERFGRILTILQALENKLVSELRCSSLSIVSHDAGGANFLEAFLRAHKLVSGNLNVCGPAEKIFSAASATTQSLGVDIPEILLATTGWQTNFEKSNIKAAFERHLRTIVFLDHWTNFKERLEYEAERLPVSEFVTFDETAKELASKVFPDAIVYCFPNYYLIEQSLKVRDLRSLKNSLEIDYLYIGEPSCDKKYLEKDAFSNFLAKIGAQKAVDLKIALRPHPSQSVESYFEMLAEFPTYSVSITQGTTLAEDLARSKAVVGCNSMALELAHMSQVPAYCAIPKPFKSELPSRLFVSWE